jgi:peroxiredoxin
MKFFTVLVNILITTLSINAQQTGPWRATITRPDGNAIIFSFDIQKKGTTNILTIHNADERISINNITKDGDTLVINMPVFESRIRAKLTTDKQLNGYWIKDGATSSAHLPFTAVAGAPRFTTTTSPSHNITGRWAATFKSKSADEHLVGEFKQKGSVVYGTFLTTTGDYRYLEGVVSGDSLKMSAFDGGHAFYFAAKVENDSKITDGLFVSGAAGKQSWTARKDARASLPQDEITTHVIEPEQPLNFSYPDLNGKMFSINDARFKDKVVIIQIMGSWCPNCMDETKFLSDYYNKNKSRGVEVIALAYEYTTDAERSRKSLQKFRDRFNVQYPMLNTGVTVGDSLRTQKTLPQITAIQMFPTSLILDRKHKIRSIDTGFNGPGTGEHYTEYVEEFERLVGRLLGE